MRIQKTAQFVEVVEQGIRYQAHCRMCGWVGKYRPNLRLAQRTAAIHRGQTNCPKYHGHRTIKEKR